MEPNVTPVKTEPALEKTYEDRPMHPRERMAIIEDAVVVALNPEATEEEREEARQKIEALRQGGEA